MAKNPSTTFYFNDWENDPELKTCSLAAQGLWMRLLVIAARSPEHGVVQIGDLTCSLPDGLAHIALAVGRPLPEIAPLIDELLSSGAASQDRKKRITCRRMIRAAALSGKRAISGRKGAEVTNGRTITIPPLPRQTPRQPPQQTAGPSRLQDFESSSHGSTITDAARASASPDGPPRSQLLQEAGSGSKWRERLDGYRPWEGKRTWHAFWGLPPDSSGYNPLIPTEMLKAWQARYAAEIAKLKQTPDTRGKAGEKSEQLATG